MARNRPPRFLNPTTRRRIEGGSILLALTGLLFMIQPFTPTLYTIGFGFLFVPGLAYVSTTFWPPQGVTVRQAILVFARVVAVLLAVLAVSIGLVPILLS